MQRNPRNHFTSVKRNLSTVSPTVELNTSCDNSMTQTCIPKFPHQAVAVAPTATLLTACPLFCILHNIVDLVLLGVGWSHDELPRKNYLEKLKDGVNCGCVYVNYFRTFLIKNVF